MHTLHVDNVTKRYGKLTAVDGVSFEASPGRILGLLGPNGAGKTSTIRMITYITAPDEGAIRFGETNVGPKTQERMGYLPEERGLYTKMKVGEQLLYFAELKGLSRKDARARVDYWLERFDANDWFGQKTSELSKGMQQKIQFIATILHDPELLILDEPFGGLDPINSELLQDVIMEIKAQNRTILFASHRMEQVEQLCDDICLISRGQIVVNGELNEIKRSFGKNTVMMDFSGSDAFLDRLEASGRVRVNARSTRHAEIRLLDGTSSRTVLEEALKDADEITRFDLVQPPMREIFVTAVTEQQGAEAAESITTGAAGRPTA
jgi:ABC-2 type transport system ATP-binding protein